MTIRDSYSEQFAGFVRQFAPHLLAVDPVEQQAIEEALIVDHAFDEAAEHFKKLDTDHRGLHR